MQQLRQRRGDKNGDGAKRSAGANTVLQLDREHAGAPVRVSNGTTSAPLVCAVAATSHDLAVRNAAAVALSASRVTAGSCARILSE